jgi:hypothetical protein
VTVHRDFPLSARHHPEEVHKAVGELLCDAERRAAAERLRAEQLTRRPPSGLVADLELLAATGDLG